MVRERKEFSKALPSLEDAWRHRASPLCLEMGCLELGHSPGCAFCWCWFWQVGLAGESWSHRPVGSLCPQPRVTVAVAVWGHVWVPPQPALLPQPGLTPLSPSLTQGNPSPLENVWAEELECEECWWRCLGGAAFFSESLFPPRTLFQSRGESGCPGAELFPGSQHPAQLSCCCRGVCAGAGWWQSQQAPATSSPNHFALHRPAPAAGAQLAGFGNVLLLRMEHFHSQLGKNCVYFPLLHSGVSR